MSETYYLTHLRELSQSINLPLRQTKRIKYSCFDISAKFIVYGASSGSIYVFHRHTGAFQRLIPSQFGIIFRILISHNEKQIAFANQKGAIGIVTDIENFNNEVAVTHLEGTDNYATCFCWTDDDKDLYCGDKKGNVSLLQFTQFMGMNAVNVTIHPILLLDSQIVQIDNYKELLLVSTLSKCVLCNTEREEFKQIGNRPRDGMYGSCFNTDNNENINDVKIYCSRPGSRLWEVDLEGNVEKTHQFKKVYCKQSKIVIENSDFHANDHLNDNNQKQSIIPFQRLFRILDKFLLIYDPHNLFIIHPRESRVLVWNQEIQNIHSVRCHENYIYILTNNLKFFSIRLGTKFEYASSILNEGRYLECAYLIKDYLSYFSHTDGNNLRNYTHFNKLRLELERQGNHSTLLNEIKSFFELQHLNQNGHHNIHPKKASPSRENGVYILENVNANITNTEMSIKDTLVSAVRGRYAKQTRQSSLNHNNQTRNYPNQRSNSIDSHTIHNISNVDDDDDVVVVVPSTTKIPPISKFSPFLFNDFQQNEEEKIVRDLFLIYKSSTISHLNFLDRYAKIFDGYDSKTIVSMLHKLESVMQENGEQEALINCVKIYFDYLKCELIWEIDDESREYIKNGFIEMNSKFATDIQVCEACGFYLRANKTCHYLEIGQTLFQYYWSRKEYEICLQVTRKVPYMLRTICKFYIQERRMDKIVQFVLNLGSKELFERAVSEIYDFDLWRRTFDLLLLLFRDKKLICLNCDNCCVIAGQTRAALGNTIFYSWNYILNVAVKFMHPKLLLNLVLIYSDQIPKGSIESLFYLNCILKAN